MRPRLLLTIVVWMMARGASADERSFDIEHLQLALTRSPFFATEGAGEVPRWDYRAAAAYRFAQAPLVLERPGERREAIQDRSVVEVQGALQIGRWVGLGLALPIVVADRGASDLEHGAALGDLRLQPRVELLHRGRFHLAGFGGLRVPTGARGRLVGEAMVVFEPRVAFQVHLGIVELGTNVGVRLRETRSYLDLTVGHEIFMSIAAAITPLPYLSAVVEIHGDTALSSRFARMQASPLELLAGLFGNWRWLRGGVAAGFGMIEGWGSPRVRVLAMLEYRRYTSPPPPPPPPPEPEVTPEEPKVAVHRGRIELADPIYFKKDRKRVRSQFLPELVQLARVLERRSELTLIWIEGHADATGPERWNLELSRLRAQAVADVLIRHGVAAARLKPVGFGEAKPQVQTPRGESNEKNRRVHFFTDSSDPLPAGVEPMPSPPSPSPSPSPPAPSSEPKPEEPAP